MAQCKEADASAVPQGGACAIAPAVKTLQPGLLSSLARAMKRLLQRFVLVQARKQVNPTEQLASVGERLLRRSQRAEQPLSVVVFELPQLPELRSSEGVEAARHAVETLTRQLQLLALPAGWTARTAKTAFVVLMPCTGGAQATAAVRDALGWPCRIEIEVNGKELALVPEVRLATLGREGRSVEEAYASMRRDIAQERDRTEARLRREAQREELRRRQTAQRERKRQQLLTEQEAERRRMDSMASSARGFHATVPATIPATIPIPVSPR